MDFLKSETKINIMRSFAGESMARNRYIFAAAQAKKENLEWVGRIFAYTAGQEEQHARVFFEYLQKNGCENVNMEGGYPIDGGDIIALLERAKHNEEEEHKVIYPQFAKIAEDEGFVSAAKHFYFIGEIEKTHGERFEAAAQMLKGDNAVKENRVCLNCGFVFEGGIIPEVCPACGHPKGFFIPKSLEPYSVK